AYRADIEARRQQIAVEQAVCQARLEAMAQHLEHADMLTRYCQHVAARLSKFTHEEKLLALDALGIRVTWYPGEPLDTVQIEGNIKLVRDDIAPISGA